MSRRGRANVVLLLALCALGAPAQAADAADTAPSPILTQEDVNNSFGGKWLWAEGSDRFTLTLGQKDGKLVGFHTMTRDNGGRQDSVPTGALPSITGDIHGTTTVVQFRSGAPGNEGWGHARLTLRGRYLYWQLMDFQGDTYLPDNVVLIRQP